MHTPWQPAPVHLLGTLCANYARRRGRRREESGLKDETGPRRNLLVREPNENLKRKSSRRNCDSLPTEGLIKSFFDVNIDKKLAKANENSRRYSEQGISNKLSLKLMYRII